MLQKYQNRYKIAKQSVGDNQIVVVRKNVVEFVCGDGMEFFKAIKRSSVCAPSM